MKELASLFNRTTDLEVEGALYRAIQKIRYPADNVIEAFTMIRGIQLYFYIAGENDRVGFATLDKHYRVIARNIVDSFGIETFVQNIKRVLQECVKSDILLGKRISGGNVSDHISWIWELQLQHGIAQSSRYRGGGN